MNIMDQVTRGEPITLELSEEGDIIFPAELVKAMCGGEFPNSATAHFGPGFAWDACEFHLEDGRLVPYLGGMPAGGPDLILRVFDPDLSTFFRK